MVIALESNPYRHLTGGGQKSSSHNHTHAHTVTKSQVALISSTLSALTQHLINSSSTSVEVDRRVSSVRLLTRA